MGKINLERVYHIEIPVNDLERAERFYVDVLGIRVHGPMAFKENGFRDSCPGWCGCQAGCRRFAVLLHVWWIPCLSFWRAVE
jgi:catechol 2,3-dioxygenase-like lactoylglutathione lyase family enzyme